MTIIQRIELRMWWLINDVHALEHGGPARMITPRKYAWKVPRDTRKIFLDQQQLGFWEVRGYSNTAEPWYNDRFRK